jgi:hypothetical protein
VDEDSRRRWPQFLAVLVLSASGFALAQFAFAQAPADQTGLRCPAGDLVLDAHFSYSLDTPGGPSSPEEALQEGLHREYGPSFPANAFERAPDAASNGESVVFEARESGNLRAFALTEVSGDSWFLSGYYACNSYIERGAGRNS